MTTKRFYLSGMHCVSCSLLIEGELEDIGVASKANYAKQYVDCTYDERRVNPAKIKDTITQLGYHVVD